MRLARQFGFTLIETILVIGIVALLSAVLAPMLTPSPNTQLRSNGSELMSALRETRLHAMRSRSSAALEVNTQSRTFRLPGKAQASTLKGEMEIQLTTAEQELTGTDSGGIRFFADGSSTGGRITLSNQKLIQHIDVEWLTGRLRLQEESP